MDTKTEKEILIQLERNAKYLRVVYGLSIITLALVLTFLAPKIIFLAGQSEDTYVASKLYPEHQDKREGGQGREVASSTLPVPN